MPFSGAPHQRVAPQPPKGAPRPSLVLDTISAAALSAHSFTRKLRTDYAGYAYQVQRASDSATLDVGFLGNAVDNAACAAFCAGTTGTVTIWYDQGTAGKHLDVAGGSLPQIYSGGAMRAMSNGVVAGYSPTAGGTLALNSSVDLFGLRGSPALTIGFAFSRASGENRMFEHGAGSAPDSLVVDAEVGRGMFQSNRTGYRQYSYDTTASLPHAMILKKPLNCTLADVTIEEGGTDLTPTGGVSTSSTYNFSSASNRLVLWNFRSGDDSFNGHIAAFIWFDSLLTGTDLAALRTEMANYA